MSAERLIASHLRLAAEALEAARTLMVIGNRYAAYQAEQAVEQIILALAQAEAIHFGRSQHHQLESMRRALPDDNPFRQPLSDVTWLEAYATTFRYPRTHGGLTEAPRTEKLQQALDGISRLLDATARHFRVDVVAGSTAPASQATPPRR